MNFEMENEKMFDKDFVLEMLSAAFLGTLFVLIPIACVLWG